MSFFERITYIMVEIIGVRFKNAGKIYYFDPDGNTLEKGGEVIVETARGMEFGVVETPNKAVTEKEVIQPLKKVLRIATDEDRAQNEANREREKESITVCLEKIEKHKLDMKLIDVELTFDLNKIIFYFTADGRVDFRELVKDLAGIFRMRIELRQIGVRDEAKLMNGIGICGRTLCCATFLDEFHPVSIKMAKEQNLSLNPTKISGICGRLMCCLKYEEDTYEYLNQNLPNEGARVRTPDGPGEVLSVSVLRQLVRVAVRKKPQDAPVISTYSIEELRTGRRSADETDSGDELDRVRDEASEWVGGDLPTRRQDSSLDESSASSEHAEPQGERRESRRRDRQDRQGQSRGDRPDRQGERRNRSDGDKDNRGERRERSDRPRADRSERQDRQPHADRPDRQDRPNRPDRQDRQNRTDRPDKQDRPERQDHADKPNDRTPAENGAERKPRGHRGGRNRNRNRDDRPKDASAEQQRNSTPPSDNQ